MDLSFWISISLICKSWKENFRAHEAEVVGVPVRQRQHGQRVSLSLLKRLLTIVEGTAISSCPSTILKTPSLLISLHVGRQTAVGRLR